MGQLYEAIVDAFRMRHIVIPVPQREVHMVSTTAYQAGQSVQQLLADRDAA